jgi:hypothetical protein
MSSGASAPRLLSRPRPGLALAVSVSCFAITAPAALSASASKHADPRQPAGAIPVPQGVSDVSAATPIPPAAPLKRSHDRPGNGQVAAPSPGPAVRVRGEQAPSAEGQRPQADARHHPSARDTPGARAGHRRAGVGAAGGQGEGQAPHELQSEAEAQAQALSNPAGTRHQREKQHEKEKHAKAKEERRQRKAHEPLAGTPTPTPAHVSSSTAPSASAQSSPGGIAPAGAASIGAPLVRSKSASVPSPRAAPRARRVSTHAPAGRWRSCRGAPGPQPKRSQPAGDQRRRQGRVRARRWSRP